MALDLRDTRTQKAFLISAVGGAFLWAWFFTDYVPFTYKANAGQIQTLEEKYRGLSKDLTKARAAVHQLPFLEKEYELLHDKWQVGRAMLPEKVEMTMLLRTLTIVGNQAGVQFVKFKPAVARAAQNYTENPIEVEVTGGYHEIGAFMSELANLDRVINVRDLAVDTNKDQTDPLGAPAHASFVAVAYTLGNTAPPPPPPDAKSAGKAKHGKKPSEDANKKPKKAKSSSKSSEGGDE